jgi:uncharacterized protein (TIGR00369 family)
MEQELIRDDHCFVCGKKNELGLKLVFTYPRPGRAEAACTVPEHFSGWRRLVHGGLLSTLLDEVMAHACLSGEGAAVTMELTVRFLKPLEVGELVRISGEIQEVKGRILVTRGEVLNSSGETVARGSARFLKVRGE